MTSHHLPRNSPMEVRNALFSRNSSRRRRRPDCATTPLRARDPAGRPGTRAMFSTRRRRRALVLVGIGYVGVPVAHVPRVESFNGSTFPPPTLGRSGGVPTSPTRASTSARSPETLTRRLPRSHLSTRAQRGRGAGLRRAPRVPRQPRGGRGGGCRAGSGRRRRDAGGRRGDRAGAGVEPPIAIDFDTVAVSEAPRATPDARRRRGDARNGDRFALAADG